MHVQYFLSLSKIDQRMNGEILFHGVRRGGEGGLQLELSQCANTASKLVLKYSFVDLLEVERRMLQFCKEGDQVHLTDTFLSQL